MHSERTKDLELHILHRPHMDSIDLDPQPILGMGSDNSGLSNSIPRNWASHACSIKSEHSFLG